jgi:molecular chaperone DnaK
MPDGPFGALADLSLISTSGISTTAQAPAITTPGFGHISDLSLISTPSAQTDTGITAELEAARAKAIDTGLVDPTDSPTEIKTAPAPAEKRDDSFIDREDLPAVVARAKPARKPGPPTVPSMGQKPPPLIAPQPFGPMEKMDEEPPTSQRPAPPRVPPGAKQPPPAIKPSPGKTPLAKTASSDAPPPATQAMPARPGPPPAPPAKPPARHSAPPPPPPRMVPLESTQQFIAPSPPQPLPPPPRSAPPPPPPPNPQFGGFGSAPPPNPQFGGFGSAAPPAYPNHPQGSQPPGAFGGFGSNLPAAHQPAPHPAPHGGYHSAPPPDASVPLELGGGASFHGQPQHGDFKLPPHGPTPEVQSPVLVDVTPRGLVVETAGGYTDVIIPRNSKIPCERTRRFATGRDMQTTVRVRVAQGEGAMFNENTYLGEVDLSGLRPAARGEVTVAVTFEVDADGTLKIRARDTQTGQEARATLQLIGVADESSVVMMINRFAHQSVVGQSS